MDSDDLPTSDRHDYASAQWLWQPETQPTKDTMNFGQAIEALKQGQRVARSGWNGKGMWLELQVPDAHSKMTQPFILMSTVTADKVPGLACQTDMLADDWGLV